MGLLGNPLNHVQHGVDIFTILLNLGDDIRRVVNLYRQLLNPLHSSFHDLTACLSFGISNICSGGSITDTHSHLLHGGAFNIN
jgi:hypothetical protein